MAGCYEPSNLTEGRAFLDNVNSYLLDAKLTDWVGGWMDTQVKQESESVKDNESKEQQFISSCMISHDSLEQKSIV
jgi:hypothetical protein